MRLRSLAIIVFLLACLSSQVWSASPEYVVTDVGTLGRDGWAESVNNLGQVVGGSYANVPGLSTGSYFLRAFRWDRLGGMTDLGTLGGYTGIAYGINDAGQVVGVSLIGGDTTSHAFRTAPGMPINAATDDVGTLGGTGSSAYGINHAGQVVGRSWIAGDTAYHAFRTAPGMPINPATDDLGTLGGTWSEAYGINAAGQVVGSSWIAGDTAIHAFRTAPGMPINPATDDLGTLGQMWWSRADGINAAGQVVGTSWIPSDPPYVSFVYRAFLHDGSAMHDLNDLIDPGSGWVLEEARGINDSGWIVGWGIHHGKERAFLLIPEPGAVAMLLGASLIGLLVCARHRWRQR